MQLEHDGKDNVPEVPLGCDSGPEHKRSKEISVKCVGNDVDDGVPVEHDSVSEVRVECAGSPESVKQDGIQEAPIGCDGSPKHEKPSKVPVGCDSKSGDAEAVAGPCTSDLRRRVECAGSPESVKQDGVQEAPVGCGGSPEHEKPIIVPVGCDGNSGDAEAVAGPCTSDLRREVHVRCTDSPKDVRTDEVPVGSTHKMAAEPCTSNLRKSNGDHKMAAEHCTSDLRKKCSNKVDSRQ